MLYSFEVSYLTEMEDSATAVLIISSLLFMILIVDSFKFKDFAIYYTFHPFKLRLKSILHNPGYGRMLGEQW